ncbi:GrdX family protein [Bacillota bacterium LX-D]|nr:GrdX family protein [Bacillota bacterium LX-D]
MDSLKMQQLLILSNNPLVWEYYPSTQKIEASAVNVLATARDMVIQGYLLVNHPLSGNLQPNQMPYKSIVLKKAIGSNPTPPKIDIFSLALIEKALELYRKNTLKEDDLEQAFLQAFQFMDLELLKTAIVDFTS